MIRPAPLAVLLCALAATSGFSEEAPAGMTALKEAEAVALALKQNPTLEMARRERNVGLIQADRSRPVFRPELSATAGQVLRTPGKDLPGTPDEVVLPTSMSRVSIELKQQLYQFGVGGAPGKRAGAMAAAARSDYRKAELDLVLQVREAYLAVLRAQAGAEVVRRAVELARAGTELTRLQKDRGFQSEVDLLQAERSQSEAESRLTQAENGMALARANLNRLLARPIDSDLTVTAPGELPGDPPPLPELVARAVAQRPEAEALRQNILAAEAGVRLAKASRNPRVDFEAGYTLQTPTAIAPQNDLAGGLRLTVPIFNGTASGFSVHEAGERLAQLRSGLMALEQGIALEIQQQRLAMQEARSRRQVADRSIAAAEKVYEITRLKLERGLAVQLEFSNARLDLERALLDRAQAEADLRIGRIRLDRALGEGPAGEPEAVPARAHGPAPTPASDMRSTERGMRRSDEEED